MPNRSLKPCALPGCPQLTRERYCKQHTHQTQKEKSERHRFYDKYIRDQKTREFYHSKAWERTRLQALMRDHYLCQYCLKEKKITPANMVHHIKEIEKAWHLRLTLSNLVSLCNSCHNKVHRSKGNATN